MNTKIWVVEYNDFCDEGWMEIGYFSTKEKAESYVTAALADEDMCREPQDYRIDWSYLDQEYE